MFSCFVWVYSDSTVGPVPEHPPRGRGAWCRCVEVGKGVLLQSAWIWQENQNQVFQACLCWRKEMLCS